MQIPSTGFITRKKSWQSHTILRVWREGQGNNLQLAGRGIHFTETSISSPFVSTVLEHLVMLQTPPCHHAAYDFYLHGGPTCCWEQMNIREMCVITSAMHHPVCIPRDGLEILQYEQTGLSPLTLQPPRQMSSDNGRDTRPVCMRFVMCLAHW